MEHISKSSMPTCLYIPTLILISDIWYVLAHLYYGKKLSLHIYCDTSSKGGNNNILLISSLHLISISLKLYNGIDTWLLVIGTVICKTIILFLCGPCDILGN